MENLDFGWGFGLIILFLFSIIYYFFSATNYIATIILGEQIKKLLDKLPTNGNSKNTITFTILPSLISAILVYFTITKLPLMLFQKTTGQYYLPVGDVLSESYLFYMTGFLGNIITMTCFSLTRYSFTAEWKVLGKLKNKQLIFNFLIYTSLVLILNFLCKNILNGFTFYLFYPLLALCTSYLLLKNRNINKPTKAVKTV